MSSALARPARELSVGEHLARLGGVASRGQLVDLTSRRHLDDAVTEGVLIRVARGRYALPTARDARLAAATLSGVVVGRSAAAHWGWSMKWQPLLPQVAVPRGRRVSPHLQATHGVAWRDLEAQDVVDGWVTAPLPTLVDCVRSLPFDEGLAIADSALRSGRVTARELRVAAARSPGRGHARAVRVAAAADRRAANPFESVLRAIALDVDGLCVVPQVRIASTRTGKVVGRVDLADRVLRIVAEADSFEFHGESELMERDCERYDELVVDDWLLLRFAWRQVMTRSAWVRAMLEAATARRQSELTGRRPMVDDRSDSTREQRGRS